MLPVATPPVDANLWADPIERVRQRIASTLGGPSDGFPHVADQATGLWERSPDGDWTGGFWAGQLWLLAAADPAGGWVTRALEWARALRARATSETVFRGFLFWYGAGIGVDVSSEAAEIALAGATGLAGLFNEGAGLIPLGRQAEEASSVGLDVANIDGVPGTVPLLVWAARASGRHELHEMAARQARTHRDLCVRDDGSVCQSARFDPRTGTLIRRFTHKGLRDDTTWARAQAWAMLGFAHAAIWLGPEFLPPLRTVADWWLDHLPDDGVARWDFSVSPTSDEALDTSGTAIAAAALLKLAAISPAEGGTYRSSAVRMVDRLVHDHLTPVGASDQRPPGILASGCYDRRTGRAVDNELVWGDYFLLEALLVLGGALDPRAV